jgi:hypothetical protein
LLRISTLHSAAALLGCQQQQQQQQQQGKGSTPPKTGGKKGVCIYLRGRTMSVKFKHT